MIKESKQRDFRYRMTNMKNDINHKNQILMNKLMAISMEKRGYFTASKNRRRSLNSLNQIYRKIENQRILKENERFAQRLFIK
jgi:hypothetical protein